MPGMKAISLKLPKGAVAKGQLYPTLSPEYLDSDALDVRLPSGVVIDVGWYPSGDKTGQFYVTAFLGTWEHRLKRLTTRSPKEAASMAEGLAERFADAADVAAAIDAALEEFGQGYRVPVRVVADKSRARVVVRVPGEVVPAGEAAAIVDLFRRWVEGERSPVVVVPAGVAVDVYEFGDGPADVTVAVGG